MTSPRSRPRRRTDRTTGTDVARGANRGAPARATSGTTDGASGREGSGSAQEQASRHPARGRESLTRSPSQASNPSGQASGQPEEPSTPRTAGRTVAALVCGLQALTLLGFCGFYAVGLARGESDSPARVVMSMVLIAAFATGLAALAVAWWRGAGWPGTPTAVWNALLLPVAWGLFQGGQGLIGGAVLVVAVVGLLAAMTSRSRRELP